MATERAASAVAAGLDPIVRALRADGYDLEVERIENERLCVRIVAGEGACEDCLSPAVVLRELISAALDGLYGPEDIDFAQPDAGG
jgi:Fe-S cluster biogenesis protein NfuA